MEKQEFIKKYNDIKDDIIKSMDKALKRALGNEVIKLDDCKGNLSRCLPLVRCGFTKRVEIYIRR